MELSQTAQQTVDIVVSNFIEKSRATTRRELVTAHEDLDIIDELFALGILRTEDNSRYIPKAIAFHFCRVATVEDYSRRSVRALAQVLRKQFKEDKIDLNRANLAHEASVIDKECGSEKVLRIGLYLAAQLGMLSGFTGGTSDVVDVVPTAISERILRIKNFESVWDEYTECYNPWPKQGSTGGIVPRKIFVLDGGSPKLKAAYLIPRLENTTSADIGDSWQGVALIFPLVLISHSSKDAQLAESVANLIRTGLRLSATDIRCTSVDGYRLPGGAKTNDQLRTEIKNVKMLIALLTRNSLASTYVLFELGARWAFDLPMIPVLAGIDASEMRGPDNALNALSCNSDSQLIQLVEDVGEALSVPHESARSYMNVVREVITLTERLEVAKVEPTKRENNRKPVEFSVTASGNPPAQFLRVVANQRVTVSELEYMTPDGTCIDSQPLSLEGESIDVPLDQGKLTRLMNTPRVGQSHFDASGPVKIGLTLSVGGRIKQHIIAARLENYADGSNWHRRIICTAHYREES